MNQKKYKKNTIHIINENYYYDFFRKQLFFKKQHIKLSKKEHTLLRLLIKARGQVVSYKEIEYYIWPDITIKHDAQRALIYRFRKKLEKNFIETVPYFGYKLVKS